MDYAKLEREFIDFLEGNGGSFFELRVETPSKQSIDVDLVRVETADSNIVACYKVYSRGLTLPEHNNLPTEMRFYGVYLKKQSYFMLETSYMHNRYNEIFTDLTALGTYEVLDDLISEMTQYFEQQYSKYIKTAECQRDIKEYYNGNKTTLVSMLWDEHRKLSHFENIVDKRYFEERNLFRNLQQYLYKGTSELIRQCEAYEGLTGNRIKDNFIRRAAYEHYKNELLQTPVYLKSHKLSDLFNTELKEAKNVWAVKKDGDRIKIEPRISIDSFYLAEKKGNDIVLGNWQAKVSLFEVEAIKYGHKVFNLDDLISSNEVAI